MSTQTIYKKVKRALEDHGIQVEVDKAVTTTSIYLRLDNGMLKSLRIGDHAGKKKYRYGYEIGTHIKNYQEFFGEYDGKVYIRLKYPADNIEDLIEAIRLERTNKILKYGKFTYDKIRAGEA
jgi:hypothetical protein